jgi:hypothetical protein
MSIRTTFVSLMVALFAAGVAADAGAQQRSQGPCAADVKKFCGDVKPGQGAIAKCMKAHEAELSPACRDGMEKVDRVAKACKSDWEKYCKSVPPGDGRILSCLKGREVDLDKACAAEFKRAGNGRSTAR